MYRDDLRSLLCATGQRNPGTDHLINGLGTRLDIRAELVISHVWLIPDQP